MFKKNNRTQGVQLRHARRRKKISGTMERPRLCVFISNKHAYLQVVDDTKGQTLCAVSSLSKDIRDKVKDKSMAETVELIGGAIAEKAVAAGVKDVVFDRSGYKYGKRLKALCEAARKGGLSF